MSVFKVQHGGDGGYTDTLCKGRVLKDDIRCEVCGTIDEVTSFLGWAKSMVSDVGIRNLIERIQRDLSLIGTEVAASRKYASKMTGKVGDEHIAFLDREIDRMAGRFLQREKTFAVPGENTLAAVFDVARCVCRRLERRFVTFKRSRKGRYSHTLTYINRLSDLLYLLARGAAKGGIK